MELFRFARASCDLIDCSHVCNWFREFCESFIIHVPLDCTGSNQVPPPI